MIIYILKNKVFNTFELRYSDSLDFNEPENTDHLLKFFTHVIKVLIEDNKITNAAELMPNGKFVQLFFDGFDQ